MQCLTLTTRCSKVHGVRSGDADNVQMDEGGGAALEIGLRDDVLYLKHVMAENM